MGSRSATNLVLLLASAFALVVTFALPRVGDTMRLLVREVVLHRLHALPRPAR